jgi:hypothetical protein
MVALVTLDRVKNALRVETADDDDLLGAYILAASQAVIGYLKGRAEEVMDLDSSGDLPPESDAPEVIQVATIMLVGHFYREPDGDTEQAFERGYLPKPVTALLCAFRDPALA